MTNLALQLESEVHLWLASPEEVLAGGDPAVLRRWLQREEVEALDRLRTAEARALHLASQALLRSTLSRYAPVRPDAWRFKRSDHGRPRVGQPPGVPDLRFSVSRRPGLLACLVTLALEAGADVERSDRRPAPLEIATSFFAASELADLRSLPGSAREARFYELWALKEAYLKARGLGLSLPLDTVAFRLAETGRATATFAGEREPNPAQWRFTLLRPTAAHVAAVAWEEPGQTEHRLVVRHAVISAPDDCPSAARLRA
jgi:4'-phosphopantetheinyl transferase